MMKVEIVDNLLGKIKKLRKGLKAFLKGDALMFKRLIKLIFINT